MTSDPTTIPLLQGEAASAVAYRGGHVQIIAAAGSGKTEVVSQRVASLLATEPPESIVAFTFTEKAAEELKLRIRQRVTATLGAEATNQLGKLFVGTIHAYCFQLLQTHVPRYETYTPLDSNQIVNFLYREATQLKLKQRFGGGRLFLGIQNFLRSVDVVENELINPATLPLDDFQTALIDYYARLNNYRFMSFGTQIKRAIEALEDPDVHQRVTADLRHLIVDEYQDVNPAQERLIALLGKPLGSADLVVVGDDDQAIYQWRGSNVENIVTFASRYDDVAQFRLLTNRRSRGPIVELANGFAQTIPGRLPKDMLVHRPADGAGVSIANGHVDEQTEADSIAVDIQELHSQGVPYRDIAVLVRGKVAYPALLDALESFGVPVQPGGRSGLFEQADASVFGATFAWIADIDWSARRWTQRQTVDLDDLIDTYEELFELDAPSASALKEHLKTWKPLAQVENFEASLVGDYYTLLGLLGVRSWDMTDALTRNRMGTIARFGAVLGDYEAVARRARRDPAAPGEQVGGAVGSAWFYRNLALLLVNHAIGGYDDFDGEEDLHSDAVSLGTIHGSKGLEWPVVFLPSLTDGRFPSSRTARSQHWLLPTSAFDASRYEGSDGDERRLFYVAVTRARDWVALSSHLRVNSQGRKSSPYLLECEAHGGGGYPNAVQPTSNDKPELALTYSELGAYLSCPQSYLLRNQLGFQAPIQGEVGYGNAVHHVMRIIAERTKASGSVPTAAQIDDLLNGGFFLPFANKPAHKQMRDSARRLISKYVDDYSSELERTWATERRFELYLPGVVVSGRADVIFDGTESRPENLTIVDYKTSTGGSIEPLQLQVYVEAGRREGLSVNGAFVHDMAKTERHSVSITAASITSAEETILDAAHRLGKRDFTPEPEKSKCKACDVRSVCNAAAG